MRWQRYCIQLCPWAELAVRKASQPAADERNRLHKVSGDELYPRHFHQKTVCLNNQYAHFTLHKRV